MVTFNRLADIPGVSYSGPTRRIKGKWPQARFARELAPDTSMKPNKLLRRLDIALYVQVMEALGRSPTFKEFARLGSPSGLEYAIREALDQEPSEAYSAYATIVEQALAGA